jgi:hypothetical protein
MNNDNNIFVIVVGGGVKILDCIFYDIYLDGCCIVYLMGVGWININWKTF